MHQRTFCGQKVCRKRRLTNKSMAWKQWMGHKGIKWPRVYRSSFHILLSHDGQKAISGNRPYVNNMWVASFQKNKSAWKPLYQPYPILLQQHVRGFHLENSVGNVLLVCEAAWLDKLLHHFKRPGIDDFYWPNILPLMTRSRTLLITWIPGHCGNNWADLCQLQSSGPDSLKRTLFQLFKPFLVHVLKISDLSKLVKSSII